MLIITKKISAKTGRSRTLSGRIQTVARTSIDAFSVMGGRSSNTIPRPIRLTRVSSNPNVKNFTVHTITLRRTEDIQSIQISSFFLRTEVATTVKLTHILICTKTSSLIFYSPRIQDPPFLKIKKTNIPPPSRQYTVVGHRVSQWSTLKSCSSSKSSARKDWQELIRILFKLCKSNLSVPPLSLG